jgi:PhnB protein
VLLPYGDYVGSVDDPFGNRWYMSAHLHEPKQKPAVTPQPPADSSAVSYIRKGFRTLTPYLLVPGAAKEIEFLKSALGAEELFRVARPGSDAVMHAEIRIGDSIVELADATAEFPARASVNVLYVPDVDATYARAIAAGAHSISTPALKPFGDRDAGFTGPGGVTWWISSRGPGEHITPDTPSLVPMFTVRGADQYIEFLKNAFGAEVAFLHDDPNGVVHHARIRIGNSIIGGGEAHGPYQSAPFLMHMYIPNIDDVYANALKAGATSVRGLEDAPYGDRTGTVQDPAGNLWSLATHIRDVKF